MAKRSGPHNFVAGDHVRVNQDAWWKSVSKEKFSNPTDNKAIAADTYRIVQAYSTNPFVAVVSDTTGRRMGLHVRLLVKMDD